MDKLSFQTLNSSHPGFVFFVHGGLVYSHWFIKDNNI